MYREAKPVLDPKENLAKKSFVVFEPFAKWSGVGGDEMSLFS